MKDSCPRQPFDYTSLDETERKLLENATLNIRSLLRRTIQDIIDIGQTLLEVKQRLPHGQYGKWLKAELGWSDFTARQFTNTAKTFKSETVSDLSFDPSALYILSAPSTPASARQEALQRANEGESISKKVAKAIVTRHKVSSTVESEDLPEIGLKSSHNSKISSQNNNDSPEYVDVDAITVNDDDMNQNLENQKSFSVGDRIRITRREQGPDKWSGKIAKLWEITDGGWLRVNVEGHKGVKFTLRPEWVELLEEPEAIEPSNIQTAPDSASLVPEQQINVSIPLEIEGKTIDVNGITHLDVVYQHQGKTETVRVPIDKITFTKL